MNEMTRYFRTGLGPWQLAVYITVGVAVAALIFFLPIQYFIVAAAGSFVLAVIASRPEIGVLIITVLVSSIVFEDSMPLIPIGIGSLHIADILLFFMTAAVVCKRLTGRTENFAATPLTLPLLLFYGVVLFSAYISITHHGKNFNDVIRILRYVTYYFLFFIVTNEIDEKRRIVFLVKGMLLIGGVVAATMVAQAMIGDSVQLMPGRIEAAETFGEEYGALRILPPGQTLLFISFITAMCITVFRLGRSAVFSGMSALVILLGGAIVLTYNRSYWVAIMLTTGFLMFLAGAEQRKRLTVLVATVAVGAGLLTAFCIYSGTGSKTMEAVSERFDSIFAGKTLAESSSLDDRAIENGYAVSQITSHPVLGIGLGNDYRPERAGLDDKLTYYVHNVYLWIMADTGLLGFLLFAWFYLLFLIRAARNWRRIQDNFLKSVVFGFMLSGVAMLPMAMVIPVFMEWFSIVAIATMMGLTDTIIRNYGTENETAR
ncbi:MAG TPA: O-antigen ligase family protein [Geobacteraceae bacterium]|nr:O-antigen ligase family protein [Geobacteraceae bacterium]